MQNKPSEITNQQSKKPYMNSQKEIILFKNKRPIYNQLSQDLHVKANPEITLENGKIIYSYNIYNYRYSKYHRIYFQL